MAETAVEAPRASSTAPAARDLDARMFAAGVAAITVATFTFLLVQLNGWPPHEDETLPLFVGRQSLGDLFDTVLGKRGGAPLHFLLAWIVAHIGGGLSTMRFLSAFFAWHRQNRNQRRRGRVPDLPGPGDRWSVRRPHGRIPFGELRWRRRADQGDHRHRRARTAGDQRGDPPGAGRRQGHGAGSVVLSARADGGDITGTEFSLDGGAFQPYEAAFTVSDFGDHTVEFRSTNSDGAVEETRQVSFAVVAHDPPATTATVVPTPVDGKVIGPASVRGRDLAMIFQDPASSLTPIFPVGQQIVEALRAHQELEP